MIFLNSSTYQLLDSLTFDLFDPSLYLFVNKLHHVYQNGNSSVSLRGFFNFSSFGFLATWCISLPST